MAGSSRSFASLLVVARVVGVLFFVVAVVVVMQNASEAMFSFGVLGDLQYADVDDAVRVSLSRGSSSRPTPNPNARCV